MEVTPGDQLFLRSALRLALQAEEEGNLPVGSVIALDGEIIAEGASAIWQPSFDALRHAEVEAIRAVEERLWPRSPEMTLYTTLEPCLMCTGAILLHRIGRVVYGAEDQVGGVSPALAGLPPYFADRFAETLWQGPALPAECDPLLVRALNLLEKRSEAIDPR
jgi:tRNA(adenine34) deaminase